MSIDEDRVFVRISLTGKEYALVKLRAKNESCTVEALLKSAVMLLTQGPVVQHEDGSWYRDYSVRAFDYDIRKGIADYE